MNAKRHEQYLKERALLQRIFADYDPKHHDAWLLWYHKILNALALYDYQRARNIL